MDQTIKIRRGTQAQIDSILLDMFELGFAVDTRKLFIGMGFMNHLLNPSHSGFPRYVVGAGDMVTIGAYEQFIVNKSFLDIEGAISMDEGAEIYIEG